MLQVFILFLIQKKLGVKKFEQFQYTNQTETDIWYYIGRSRIIKVYLDDEGNTREAHSNVSLNWLLDDRCKIIKKEV